MISLILSVLILTFKAASSAVIPNFDLKSTDQLLTSLAAHQQGLILDNTHTLQYLGVESNDVTTGSEHVNFQKLPQYIVCYIFEFLDYKSGKSFLETSKYFHDSGKRNILNRLTHFSPRFVFPSDWLNHAMACELSNLFKSPLKFDDPQILDEYELATIKSIRAGQSAHQMPPKIQSKLASYLFEMLYDAEIEMRTTDEAHWRVFFIDKLFKNGKALYPKTLEYYKSFVRDECALKFKNETDVEVKTERIMEYILLAIDFFSNGDVAEEEFLDYAAKVRDLDLENILILSVPFHLEFEVALYSHFHQFCFPGNENDVEDMKDKMKLIVENQEFSQSFLDRFVHIPNTFPDATIDILSSPYGAASNRIFFKAAMRKLEMTHWTYIYDCTPQNRFEVENLLQYPDHLIDAERALNSLVAIKNPTLTLIDAITKLKLQAN